MTSAPRTPRRASRDPYGLLPAGTPIAAIVSMVGLVIVAVVTLSLSSGKLPFNIGGSNGVGGGNASGAPEVARTATPSNIVVVPSPAQPGITVPGILVYAKDGNIWVQSGGQASQLTSSGSGQTDSMPSFSEDGTAVYFIRTRRMQGKWSVEGVVRDFRLDTPAIMRVAVAGGDPVKILDGLVDPSGQLKWQGFIRGPRISPNGRTIAITTDMPDPTTSDVTLKLVDIKTDKITDLNLSQVTPLGHQDATWSPDGLRIAYVREDRDGAKGTPSIYQYNMETKKARAVTGPGYLQPSYSPDGRYLAATKTNAFGTDVVILDANTGTELVRVTSDGDSWGPSWSPAGNQIAYLHVSGVVVDLKLVQLNGSAPAWEPTEPIDLTSAAGLDGVSRPDWHVPADQMPVVTPVPAASSSLTP